MSKQTKDPRKKKLKLKLRCNLTDEERLQFGQMMAETINEIGNLKNDAKSMASDFKARIASREAQLNSDKNVLQVGYQYRDTECEITFDQPTPGKKTIRRLDTGATVETTAMTDEEKQMALELEEAK